VSVHGNVVLLESFLFALLVHNQGYISVVGWNPPSSGLAAFFGWEVPDFANFAFSGCATSYMKKFDSVTGVTTLTTVAVTFPSGTIQVTPGSTAPFAAFGNIAISGGLSAVGYTIRYTSKDANNFFGCTGGFLLWPIGSTITQILKPHENYEHLMPMVSNFAILKNDGTV
jgi:hypothetical protein